jgi:mRNA interferase MazF
MIPQPGEVWIADIPFTSGTASKLRPVLVLWTDAADVVVAAVTSAPSRSRTGVALQNWPAAGLRVASTGKPIPTGLLGTKPPTPSARHG